MARKPEIFKIRTNNTAGQEITVTYVECSKVCGKEVCRELSTDFLIERAEIWEITQKNLSAYKNAYIEGGYA